jgi:hypothetical protein
VEQLSKLPSDELIILENDGMMNSKGNVIADFANLPDGAGSRLFD